MSDKLDALFNSPDFPEEWLDFRSNIDPKFLTKSLEMWGGRRMTITGDTERDRRNTMAKIQRAMASIPGLKMMHVLRNDDSSLTLGILIPGHPNAQF